MAIQVYNPGTVTGNSATGLGLEGPPIPRTNYGQLQSSVQQANPFIPNNGNPRGANNMPRQFTSSGFPMPVPGGNQYGNSATRPQQQGYKPNQVQPGGQVSKPGMGYDPTMRQERPPQGGSIGLPVDPRALRDSLIGRGGPPVPSYGQQPQRPMGSAYGGEAYGPPRPRFDNQGGGYGGYFGGQSMGTGRYRPPMMDGSGNWQDQGGYNYNLPNAFGSYPGYGQGSPYSGGGYGYGGLYPGGG